MEEPVAKTRLAWGPSAPVSVLALGVNHHTAEAPARRRPGHIGTPGQIVTPTL
jgi:hypothetical protein